MGPHVKFAVVVALALPVAGCGDTLPRAQLDDLQKRLAESQRRQAAAEQKIEALEDKVFLLTDQVESQKVESARRGPPRLPVVALRPAEPAAAPSEGGDDIVFEGDARSADPGHARPRLVLDGDRARGDGERARRAEPAPTTPAPSLASENLGVAPVPPIAHAAAAHDPAHEVDPMKLYRASYEALRAGRHDEAARGFREFVRRFPEHDLADNAQYWLGECFYDRKQFVEAATEFRAVVSRYPLGNKAPDALLKLAFCLLQLGDVGKARDLLVEVPKSYPRTEAARLAEARLAELAAPMGGTQ